MAGSKARSTQYPCRHYLGANIVFGDDATQIVLGFIPENAVVVAAWAEVHTAFNDSGTDLIDIGYDGDTDEYCANLDVSTVGTKLDATTFNAAAVKRSTSGDLKIVAQYDGANSDATAGEADVFVEYIVRNQAPDGVTA